MKILSIEPTPSPNTMKVLLDQELPAGKSNNYKKETANQAPEYIQQILLIEGIKGVYHVADFLAVERNAKFDWKDILQKVRQVFGEETSKGDNNKVEVNEHFGEVQVFVHLFKGIPMQIKLLDGEQEHRKAMPELYVQAISKAQKPDDNVVLMRKWKELGIRYGELEQIATDVIDELVAAYPKNRISALVDAALQEENEMKPVAKKKEKLSLEALNANDWQVRYRALEGMDDPSIEDLPLLEKALEDEKPAIRRLATVYLGMIEDKQVLPLLYKALKDKTITVRRTAGDCLSDLGFDEAMEEMMVALNDKNKLVRWRAAMFLYEVGDEKALPALKNAENDPEFEVSLQVKMAIERIEGGESAKGSVWKQMTEARKSSDSK